VTPADFRARLKALGLTLGAFASLTGTNPVTVSYWGFQRSGRGVQTFPKWVGLLLDAWERCGRVPE
jgi:hypothetical protein